MSESSNSGVSASRRLASSIASAVMPRPRSWISRVKPLATRSPSTCTAVCGRREHRGVLQQFRDQMRQVGDRAAVHGQPGQAPHLDALVVLDLGDGRADDVHELYGLAPLAGGRGAGEDDQPLGVAAHAGGEVVEPEEVGQFVGVLGAALHGVQEGELAVQQDLVAAGEVDEDLGDAAPHVGLFDGGLDGGPLEGVERLADLAHLVVRRSPGGALPSRRRPARRRRGAA